MRALLPVPGQSLLIPGQEQHLVGSPGPTALQAALEAAKKSQATEGWNKSPVTLSSWEERTEQD